MKRFLAAAAIIALSMAALVFMPRAMPVEALGHDVQQRLSKITGLEIASSGAAELTLLPLPALKLRAVSMATPDGVELVTSEALYLRLSPLSLLAGDAVVTSLTLERPSILVRTTAKGTHSWYAVNRALKPRRDDGGLAPVTVSGGRLVYHDSRDGTGLTLTDINGSITLDDRGRLRASGTGSWRRQTVEVDVRVEDMAAMADDGVSPFEARFEAAPGSLALEGNLDAMSGVHFNGTLAVDAAAAERLAVWLTGGWDRSRWPQGPLRLRAGMRRAPGTLSLSDITLALGDTRASGALVLKSEGERPLLQGTFAATVLDLDPLLRPVAPYLGDASNWSQRAFASDGLSSMDMELRVSADRMALAGADIANAAILFDIHNSALSVQVQDASAFDGALSASLRAAPGVSGMDIKATLTGRNLALAGLSRLLTASQRIDGMADVKIALEGSGASPETLAHDLGGSISFTARNGAIQGVDLRQIMRRLERTPLGIGRGNGGRTPFSLLACEVEIIHGEGTVRDARLESENLIVTLAGRTHIGERRLELAGTALAHDATPPFALPFTIGGSWRFPSVQPDVATLLRRSGAAAPLLGRPRQGGAEARSPQP